MFQTVFGGRQYPSEVCESWTCKIRTTCHECIEYYWQSNLKSAAWLFKRMCIFPASEWFILGDPGACQSGREKRRDESFQARAEEPLGTDSHRTTSKWSSECWLLIGHKKCFVLLCPIGEQHLPSSFCEFVHDGYWLDHGLSGSCTEEMHAVRKLSVWYKLSISKYCLPEN